MTFRFSNRVKVTASAPGTAAFPATAAATGFIGFNSIPSIANGDIVPYTAWDGGANWETGWATYNSTGPVLTRTTIVQNSLGNTSAINFSSGIVTIYCDATAASLPLKDSSGNLALPGTLSIVGALSGVTSLAMGGALSGATTINASGLITSSLGFEDGGGGNGFHTNAAGYDAYLLSTRLQSNYPSYAIVIASDERYKTFLKDDTAKRRANVVALHIGPFVIYEDQEKTKGGFSSFGVSAQQAYSLFGEGYLGVRPPSKDDPNGKWHAEASPTGLQALWAARQALIELDAVRAEMAELKALLTAKG